MITKQRVEFKFCGMNQPTIKELEQSASELPPSNGLETRLEQARQLLEVIGQQLECPARNTTMSSYRRDGSVIISNDIRQQVREWLMENTPNVALCDGGPQSEKLKTTC